MEEVTFRGRIGVLLTMPLLSPQDNAVTGRGMERNLGWATTARLLTAFVI